VQKSIKMYVENSAAVRAWRDVGRSLGLTVEELEQIGGGRAPPRKAAARSLSTALDERVEARQMLERWMEKSGDEANSQQLLSVVKRLKLNHVAGNNISFSRCKAAACTL